jgi:multidrug resistance efflux pump
MAEKRRSWVRIVVALLVVASAVIGYAFYSRNQTSKPYEWYGTIEARTISVGSRFGGRVHEVRVREGDHVEVGQILLVLEPGDLHARLMQAEGQLAEAKAGADLLKAGSRPEEIAEAKARSAEAKASVNEAVAGPRSEDIAAARARLEASQARLEKATLDVERARTLAQKDVIARNDVDAAETALRVAAGEREADRQALDALTRGTRPEQVQQAEARATAAAAAAKVVEAGSRVEDQRAAQARVTTARGNLMQVQTQIDELTIRAPRAARVESLDLRPGDILAPNATAAKLLEPGELFVRIYVPETQLGHIRPGLEVPVSVDSFPDRTFPGVVESVNAQGEFTPRNLQTADERANQVFATRIRINASGSDDASGMLRAGMAASVRVPR